MEKVYNELLKFIPKDNIYLNEPMSKHTSFKIGGNADFFVKVENNKELKSLIDMSKINNIPLTIIGNGSNILVKDNGIRGIVAKIDIKKIEIVENENDIIVILGAGELLGKIAQILLKNSIEGFEFASGIPGTVGGAVKMNAGAYGGEFKDIIKEVTYMDLNGNINILTNEQCGFSYRYSIFSDNDNYIVLEAKFILKKGNYDEIKEKMDEYAKSRREKQPITMPSAGSTFKRGEDFITAKLIDECGLKGYSIGGAEVSNLHAGFVVNKGNATAEDVINLIEYIKKQVYEKFEKKIELEIQIIGE